MPLYLGLFFLLFTSSCLIKQLPFPMPLALASVDRFICSRLSLPLWAMPNESLSGFGPCCKSALMVFVLFSRSAQRCIRTLVEFLAPSHTHNASLSVSSIGYFSYRAFLMRMLFPPVLNPICYFFCADLHLICVFKDHRKSPEKVSDRALRSVFLLLHNRFLSNFSLA